MGRLLADACPLGTLKSSDPKLHAFAFRAKPDGNTRIVLVAWSDDRPRKLTLPSKPLEVYDVLGRAKPEVNRVIELSAAPVMALLPDEAAAKLDLEPPPAPAPWLDGKPSPIVLQAVMPRLRVSLEQSAYHVTQGQFDRIPIYVYNFGSEKVEGRLTLKGPKGWNLKLPEAVQAASGDRIGLGLTLDVPKSAGGIETITIEGDFQAAGEAVLSFRLLPEPR